MEESIGGRFGILIESEDTVRMKLPCLHELGLEL